MINKKYMTPKERQNYYSNNRLIGGGKIKQFMTNPYEFLTMPTQPTISTRAMKLGILKEQDAKTTLKNMFEGWDDASWEMGSENELVINDEELDIYINFKLQLAPDLLLYKEGKIIGAFEIKTSKFPLEKLRKDYDLQLKMYKLFLPHSPLFLVRQDSSSFDITYQEVIISEEEMNIFKEQLLIIDELVGKIKAIAIELPAATDEQQMEYAIAYELLKTAEINFQKAKEQIAKQTQKLKDLADVTYSPIWFRKLSIIKKQEREVIMKDAKYTIDTKYIEGDKYDNGKFN